MRLLKMIFAGLFAAIAIAAAIAAGFVAAAVVGAIGLAVYLIRRLLGRPQPFAPRSAIDPHRQPAGATDAIDVTVSEVRTEQPER